MTTMYGDVLHCFSVLFLMPVWCLCKAINVSVQCNGGLLPDIIVDPMLLPSGNPFKCHKEVLYSPQVNCTPASAEVVSSILTKARFVTSCKRA